MLAITPGLLEVTYPNGSFKINLIVDLTDKGSWGVMYSILQTLLGQAFWHLIHWIKGKVQKSIASDPSPIYHHWMRSPFETRISNSHVLKIEFKQPTLLPSAQPPTLVSIWMHINPPLISPFLASPVANWTQRSDLCQNKERGVIFFFCPASLSPILLSVS